MDLDLLPCDNIYRFTAVDALGNVATIAGVVRRDGEAPAFTSPGDQVITAAPDSPCGEPAGSVTFPDPATDACDGVVPVTCDAPASFAVGVTRVTCTSSDRCGNVATGAFDVRVLPGPASFVVDAGPDVASACPPGRVLLQGIVTGGGAAGVDVAWSPAVGAIDPGALVTDALLPGTYVLTVTDLEFGGVSWDSVDVAVDAASLLEPSRVPSGPPRRETRRARRGSRASSALRGSPLTTGGCSRASRRAPRPP